MHFGMASMEPGAPADMPPGGSWTPEEERCVVPDAGPGDGGGTFGAGADGGAGEDGTLAFPTEFEAVAEVEVGAPSGTGGISL